MSVRFVLVGPAPPLRGGIAQHTAATAHALGASGHQVEVLGITDSANTEFMTQVARNITGPDRGPVLSGVSHLIMDNDRRFAEHFRPILRNAGTVCPRIPARAPDCNSFAKRWVRSIKTECLAPIAHRRR